MAIIVYNMRDGTITDLDGCVAIDVGDASIEQVEAFLDSAAWGNMSSTPHPISMSRYVADAECAAF